MDKEAAQNLAAAQIVPLEKAEWQGYCLEFRYTSHNYYDVEVSHTGGGFNASFVKKPYDTPFKKQPDGNDMLFQPWWDDIKVWGVHCQDKLMAAIETAVEEWNNRLRVTELWVHEDCRRRGIAVALMDKAIERAKAEKRRAVVLETQSCNEGAINFYINYGFSLIGFDACAYQNNDLDRKEVRMEFGILLNYDS